MPKTCMSRKSGSFAVKNGIFFTTKMDLFTFDGVKQSWNMRSVLAIFCILQEAAVKKRCSIDLQSWVWVSISEK